MISITAINAAVQSIVGIGKITSDIKNGISNKDKGTDLLIQFDTVRDEKKNVYYNKEENQCYFIGANGMECEVMHKGAWDHMTDEDWETPGFE